MIKYKILIILKLFKIKYITVSPEKSIVEESF